MPTKKDLTDATNDFFSGNYEITSGSVIPNVQDIEFGKRGRELDLAMLFIDIRESTKIVDGFRRVTAARMYKSFLNGVSRIAKDQGGELRSFNGDGVLMAFIGDSKCTNAVKAAMHMSWFIKNILQPKVESYMVNNQKLKDLSFDFGIGIDVGKVLVVRGGMKGENNNDLVWAGNATNYAVKLSSCSKDGYNIYISENVYKTMGEKVKYHINADGSKTNMWEERVRNDIGGITVYKSKWSWGLD